MQKISIVTDSASDIPANIAQELGIKILPIPITHEECAGVSVCYDLRPPIAEDQALEQLINDTMPSIKLDGIYSVGASVAINCGPKVLALVYAGEKRGQ
jgi:fatty acid-binding protein DegV